MCCSCSMYHPIRSHCSLLIARGDLAFTQCNGHTCRVAGREAANGGAYTGCRLPVCRGRHAHERPRRWHRPAGSPGGRRGGRGCARRGPRHGDVAPSAAVSTAERAGSTSTAAAATTAAAGCQAASRGAVQAGAASSVAAGRRGVASAPPPPAPEGHRHRAPRPVVRGAAVAEWSISRRGTPPRTSKGRHAVAFGGGGDRGGRCRYLPSHRPPRRALRRAAEGR